MASTASFRKDLPRGVSVDHDGADTRVADPFGIKLDAYQMVPRTGSRTFNVRISGEVRIEVFSILGAEISIDGFPPAKSQVLKSAAPSERTFTIHGRGECLTTIFALDENRTILDRMAISIKNERPVTYNLHRLGDSLRVTRRTIGQLRSLMTTVEDIYLKQASVRLVRSRENEKLLIKENLGDPIDLSNPDDSLLSAISTNFQLALKKRLSVLGFLTENLNLVSTWRLRNGRGDSLAGFTPPELVTVCICEAKDDPVAEATTYAHEMGHALGLRHPGHFPSEMMNDGGVDSFRMIRSDIDTLNPSGTKGLPQR